MMKHFLAPRSGRLTGNIQGVIDLEPFLNLKGRSLESEVNRLVELRSMHVDESDAWEGIVKGREKQIFRDEVVAFEEVESAQRQLEAMPSEALKLVVSPCRFKDGERHTL